MKKTTENTLKKYNIKYSDIDSNAFEIPKETKEQMNKITKKLTPLLAKFNFSNFVEDLKNRNYKGVYASSAFNVIEEIYKNGKFTTLKKGTKIFRARIVGSIDEIINKQNGIEIKDGILQGYDWVNSKEPPVGVNENDGRANCKYSSYFYCANNMSTAASEIKANIGDYISVATFTTEQDIKLLELIIDDTLSLEEESTFYKNYIAVGFSTPINDNNYFLTQFVSDELRKYGIDGICYKSHFTGDWNYVIFNCSINIIRFENSRIIKLYSQQLNFIDISYEKIRTTKLPKEISDEELLKEKCYLYSMIELADKYPNTDFKPEESKND